MDYSVFNLLNFPVCVIGAGGELIYRNDVFSGLIKGDDDASIALDTSHPFYSEYRKRIALSYHRALSGSETRCFAVLRGSGGEQIPVEIYLYPMKGPDGTPSILAFFKQVDARMVSFDGSVKPENEGEASSNIFEFSPFPIVRIDTDGGISALSASAELITGCPNDTILGHRNKFDDIFSSYDLERIRNGIRDILEGYASFRRLNDIRITTHMHESRFANAVIYPVISDGRIIAAEILFEDVTRISYLEKRLTSMNRGVILGDMVEGLLHTFSNMVNVAMSRSQFMMQLTEKNVMQEGLRSIYEAAMEGAKQIKSVQEFMSGAPEEDETGTQNILELIDDAVEFTKMQFKVEQKDNRRDVRISRMFSLKGSISGNIRVLREIVVSMIFRAAGYIADEGEVVIELRQSGDIILSVSARKHGEIDEQRNSSDIEIRRLAEKVHVRIIEEESSESITIKAVIPGRMLVHDEDVSDSEDGLEAVKIRDMDILIVEDEEALRLVLSELFDSMGNRISLAVDGPTALESIRSQRFDLIVTDYGIPGLSGLDLIAKARELYPEIITVLLSGWNLAIKPGEKMVDLYLPKPFQLDILLREIARVMKSRQ